MTLPFFDNSIIIESFRRDGGRVDIYFKDYFYLFYFHLKEHKNRPGICIGKIKRKNKFKSYLADFKRDERCKNLKDFLFYYKGDLRDPNGFRNLSYCEYRRFISLINSGEIKDIHGFEQIKTYLKGKVLKDIIKKR